jgi:hypothetical protein
LTATVSGLSVGKTWYFRVKAKNSQGTGSPTASKTYFIISGPRIWYNGAWAPTILYVRSGGVWKQAVAYVRENGSWKAAGG